MDDLDLVVFDFDGTLAETRDAVSAVVNAALHAHALPRVTPPFIHRLMGLPLATLFRKTLPPPQRSYDTTTLVAWYRQHFDAVGAPLVDPIAGAVEAVASARRAGLKVAVATSRERSSLDPLLARFGLDGAFDALSTCDQVTHGKPHPETLERVLAACDVVPERAWMVGDTTWDVEMAAAAGVRCFGVPHGCHDAERLAEAGAEIVPDLATLAARW